MKKFLVLLFLVISPAVYAGFPESVNGYDIEKIKKAFRLPCKDIGKDECISRSLGLAACVWIFEINRGVEQGEALRTSDAIFLALMSGNKLNAITMFQPDGTIKLHIKREAVNRINFCRKATIQAIPNMVKLPDGMELTQERIESLTNSFPNMYLNAFEQIRKTKDK